MHRALLELLEHDEVTLHYKNMRKNEGHVDWDDIIPPTNVTILVDANTNPTEHVSAVVHELLHVTLYPCFVGRFTEEYQEIAVLAYEQDMFKYIQASKDRLAKWNGLIKRKLTAEPAPETALDPAQ